MTHARAVLPLAGTVAAALACLPALAQEAPRYAPAEGAVIAIENRVTTRRDGVALSDSRSRLQLRVTSSGDGMRWEAATTVTYEENRGLEKLTAAGMAEYLRAVSAGRHLAYRSFMLVEATTVTFTPAARPDGSFVGAGAGNAIRTWLHCPWAEFDRFFPIGRTPVLSMRCTRGSTLPGDDRPRELGTQILVADDGIASALPGAGDVLAHRVRVTEVTDSGFASERVLLFSERLGIPLRSDTTRQVLPAPGQPAVIITDHNEVLR